MTEQVATQEHLEFLDMLRESGITNMFGAGTYIEQEFDVTKQEARAILKEWMASFSERHGGD